VDDDTLLNPVLIAEVLSKSTENYDRGRKFERYRRIASFREYLLVAQKRVFVERHARMEGPRTTWIMTEYTSLEDVIELISVPVRLRLANLYDKVSFPVKRL
jgi:Uma2 family endonuclease